jgi:hypothetical protein
VKIHYGTVYLPHINYTVRFRRAKKAPAAIDGAYGWAVSDDKYGCTVFLSPKDTVSGVAHELVHVLRYICEERHMDFRTESEHMAYIMQHLMGFVLDFRWKKK